MSNRSFLYLSIFTLILLMTALVSNLLQPKFETTINKGNLVFNNLKKDLNNVTQIKINNGLQEIIISKNNSDWNMQTKHGYKVKEDFVKERLIQTSELRFFEKKTKDKFLYSRLDLDYPENEEGNSKLITINDQDEKILAEFILGKEKKNGVYIKTIDGTETWLTNGLLQMPNEINQWLDTLILNIEYESIKKIKLEHADENILLISKKNKEDENFIIDNLPKGKIPKSDLIGNFLGYFFTNLFFEDVSDRKEINNNNLITKIRFDLFNDFFIEGAVFKENDSKWINFTIDQESSQKLFNEQKVLVENINEWSYKLQSTKYNTLDTKLKDLLVED